MQEPTTNPNELSKQEREVLQCVAEGKPNRHIANDMCLSAHTIKNHKANIKKKLGLSSCIQLYKGAIEWLTKASNSENKENRGWGQLFDYQYIVYK